MLEVKNLTFGYDDRPLLRKINFRLEPGKLYALMGPNGSGKSTLLQLLTGILHGYDGRIIWQGRDLNRMAPGELASLAATVWTTPPLGSLTVDEVLHTGIRRNWKPARGLLHQVTAEWELEPLLHRPLDTLSDGEKQRVMIARAWLQDTPVMLLDEPTTHLDLGHKARVLTGLRQAVRRGKTVLFSTHEMQLVADVADRILLLRNGRLDNLTPGEAMQALPAVFSNDLITFDPLTRTVKLKTHE